MDSAFVSVLGATALGLVGYTLYANLGEEVVKHPRKGKEKRTIEVDSDKEATSVSGGESSDEENALDSGDESETPSNASESGSGSDKDSDSGSDSESSSDDESG